MPAWNPFMRLRGPQNPVSSGNGFLYTGAIQIAGNTTLKAIARATGKTSSNIMSEVYAFKAATPTASPAAGSYADTQTVTLSTAPTGATIHFTTDGSDPVIESILYSEPISISDTTTLKARAFKSGYADSDVLTASYTIGAAPTSGYNLWFKGDDAGSLSSSVSSWPDASGNSNDASQATSGNQPSVVSGPNSHRAVSFDGSNDNLVCGTSIKLQPCTIFAVVSPADFSANRTVIGATNSGGLQLRFDSSTGKATANKEDLLAIGTSTNAYPSGSYSLLEFSLDDSGNFTFFKNGVANGSGTTAVTLSSLAPVLGCNGQDGDDFFSGPMIELIAYPTVLSSDDRQPTRDYMTSKYSIS